MQAKVIDQKWLLEWFDERMCYHMPSLIQADNGNLLAVWNGGFLQWNGDPMGRDAQDWVSILEPGAENWSNPEAVGCDIRYACHDPIWVRNKKGEIILIYAKFLDTVCNYSTWCNGRDELWTRKTKDGGRTWEPAAPTRLKTPNGFEPIKTGHPSNDGVVLDDLLGYDKQKAELRRNPEAFLNGKKANNVLLYGDAGTGKSTSVKALINEYYDQGLRMIEIYKHQFRDLSAVIAAVKNRNYRFMIFIDDLSFEEHEVEYKFLKAVIEGGVETRPDNVLIYATSNRRNLVRDTWNDRSDMEHHGDIHRSDTVEEKTSLSARFGVKINYNVPTQKEYHAIVLSLARRRGITMEEKKLLDMANTWERRHRGFSGRVAQQFVDYLESLPEEE